MIFEELLAKHLPKLIGDIKPQMLIALKSRLNIIKTTPKHITVKSPKEKQNKTKKNTTTFQDAIRLTADFSIEIMKARK